MNVRGFAPRTIHHEVRELRSDYLLVQLPGGDDQWVGFRDVFVVDGRPVRDRRQRFQELFTDADPIRQWRRLNDESARFNVGEVRRNINVPTFALKYLRRATLARLAFRKEREERVRGATTWVLAFTEQHRPTLITDEEGRNVPAHGRFWIVPADGRVLRTELRVAGSVHTPRTVITTEYEPNRALSLLVPTRMREVYYGSGDDRATGEARYSNFRRFETGGRVLTPK